jgi:transposase
MSRVEVLSGPERRRRWSTEQKRSIVAEAFASGG